MGFGRGGKGRFEGVVVLCQSCCKDLVADLVLLVWDIQKTRRL